MARKRKKEEETGNKGKGKMVIKENSKLSYCN